MRRFAACIHAVLVMHVLAVDPAPGQPVPPYVAWQTVTTEHFRVTFAPGLDSLAREAAVIAERARERLASLITRPPTGTIDILLTDHVDLTNGFAGPFPSNRIVVWARPPVDDLALAYNRDWLELVVTHELTHIFHLDRGGGFASALRKVFGRVPLWWPLFPALGTPNWTIEGLAVLGESELTGAGRLYGSYHDMVVRTAALRDAFEPMDRLNAGSPIWPGGQREYVYGSLFLEYLADKYGWQTPGELVDRTASAALPPFLFWDRVAKRTFGESFDDAYAAWRADVASAVSSLADSLGRLGLTAAERVTDHGWYALHPRVSPDGRRVAYASFDGRTVTATRVVDAVTGNVQWQRRRNGLGGHTWLPDGSGLIVSQLEYTSTYEVRQDLYVVRPDASERVTRGARLQDPDVARDGRQIVVVENGGGGNRLVVVDRETGSIRHLSGADRDVLWAFPRWSPDGSRIAAARFETGGEYDVVVLDTAGAIIARITSDRAIDTHPTWSPDGKWLLFSSDRTGIPNLFAADITTFGGGADADGVIRQVTNTLTGAFHPDVSRDGRWIYFSEYDADGFHIARLPFDPAAWRDPPPARLASASAVRATNGGPSPDVQVGPARPYSPLRTARPTWWSPEVYGDGEIGPFFGAATGGSDLVGRLAWGAALAIEPGTGRWQGQIGASLGRLGNPRIDLAASREWEDLGVFSSGDTLQARGVEREDVVGVFATFQRPRWRSSAVLSIGVERTLRQRSLEGVPGLTFRDADDDLIDFIVRVGFANYRSQPFSISREDGVSVNAAVERRIERNSEPDFPREQTEVTGRLAVYKALHPFGFANHVVALRVSGLLRTDEGASPERIGGVSGSVAEVAGFPVGAGVLLLPVRGFDRGVRWGTRAWTATAEYRVPIALMGRRPALSPLFIDRVSLLAFVDAGDAWCTGNALTLHAGRCGVLQDGAVPDPAPLLAAGAELVLDAAFSSFAHARVRAGLALPVQGPEDTSRLYLQVGSSF